jgi:hypothetical protein
MNVEDIRSVFSISGQGKVFYQDAGDSFSPFH